MKSYRIKDVVHVNRLVLSENTSPNFRFRYIDIGSVNDRGQIDIPADDISFESAPSRARRIAPFGAVVVSTVRTYLRAIATVPRASDPLVFSTGFAALEAGPELDPRFLAYYCRSHRFIDEVVSRSVGVSYPAVNSSDIEAIPIPVPPLEEQRRVADFLDAETARIDLLVDHHWKLLSLVGLREKATIRDVLQVHDQGDIRGEFKGRIPWLGSTPAHWGAAPLRYISRIQRGASPRPIDDPVYFDENGSYSWVRISDVTSSGKYLTRTDQKLSSLGESLSVKLEPGELFVSIAASVGKPVITKIRCCIHDGFVAIRDPKVNTEFLYYILLLGDAFDGLGKLGTQLNLNTHSVGSIAIPIPPEVEQREIVGALNREMCSSLALRGSLSRQIELLVERHQALITAAVTGQIDVSTASGRGIEE
ncbi:restriction endonuclease subunit S [Saccharopolyspora elongata]|uniref:Restriction endonuclease subunit S n=1 Tax=Saccharopolyspora elongata TaxID=2530387 RepID=A0A4R4Y634_9PSEU|nr:restriction endonuclease subunit S [Saccharopolyspora elongata]TDD39881.1 restriction endonuclease subunit S [Saccharopolyspora elongata]